MQEKISLHPMKFEEAVEDILKVKPQPKAAEPKKQKRAKSEPLRAKER